jgi:hypothetical protein
VSLRRISPDWPLKAVSARSFSQPLVLGRASRSEWVPFPVPRVSQCRPLTCRSAQLKPTKSNGLFHTPVVSRKHATITRDKDGTVRSVPRRRWRR